MKRFDIHCDPDVRDNPDCERCANAECRHTDKKTGLCEKIRSVVDGLPVRCVGSWANEKIYYLLQYFQIFTKSMHNKWDGKLRYVEVCSGPGRCSTRDGKEQDGTALSIVKNELFDLLSCAIFIDYNPTVVDVLSQRIATLGKAERAHVVVGDFNNCSFLARTLAKYSPRSLSLCFIDPTDCSLPFDAVRSIFRATNGRCDFLISFFDGLDYHRNAATATLNDSCVRLKNKYSRFVGSPDFFSRKDVVEAAQAKNNNELSQLFRNAYAANLKAMGLIYQDWKSVKNYYRLLFASSNPRGLDFWKKATKCDPVGQSTFDFGEES